MIKLNKVVVTLMVILVFITNLFSQKENNIWHFGNKAGIDFNTNPPTPLLNGEMNTVEGCASLSNTNGDLICYTNGEDIWDASHQIMQNGSGLLGDHSAAQGVIIVPLPDSDSINYIFTTDEGAIDGVNGLRYSIMNTNLNNGMGAITSIKNILLTPLVTESLTAILHCNGQDIWVISRTPNGCYAYLITPNGLDTVPVISSFGNMDMGYGSIKASPDGKLLVVTQFGNGFNKGAVLYNFDNLTGMVSNARTITTNSIYGAEFSPSSEVLYLGSFESGSGDVYQYDLTASNIQLSQNVVGTLVDPFMTSLSFVGTLQLAPDNKIYISKNRDSLLTVINDPNELGAACNLVDDGFDLGSGKNSRSGLPQAIIKGNVLDTSITSIGPFCSNNGFINLPEMDSVGVWSGSGIIDSISGIFDPSIADIGNNDLVHSSTENCIESRLTVIINSGPIASFEMTPNPISKKDSIVNFEDLSESQSNITWEWFFGELGTSNEQNPSFVFPQDTGCYEIELIVTDTNGCTDTLKRKLIVEEEINMFVPSAFTPNGDRINDFFKPQGTEINENEYRLVIFNRWGEKVFETTNMEEGWNGNYNNKTSPNGIYIYSITYKENTKTGRFNLIK